MYIFLYLKRIICLFLISGVIGIGIVSANAVIKEENKKNEEDKINVPIIMYHHVLKNEKKSGKYVIKPDEFEDDLKYLKSKGYRTVLIRDLIEYVYNGKPLPEKPVVITFDDGYESNYSYIYPILKKYNEKMVLSIVGILCDEYSKTEESHIDYSYVKWSQVKEMSESGLVEIANHTYNCHSDKIRKGINKVSSETDEEYNVFLSNDLRKLNEEVNEYTNTIPQTFTYPFGYAKKSSYEIIKSLGFKATLSCEEGENLIAKGDYNCLYMLKRYNRPSGISREIFFDKMNIH